LGGLKSKHSNSDTRYIFSAAQIAQHCENFFDIEALEAAQHTMFDSSDKVARQPERRYISPNPRSRIRITAARTKNKTKSALDGDADDLPAEEPPTI
jgi:hypothetical protein